MMMKKLAIRPKKQNIYIPYVQADIKTIIQIKFKLIVLFIFYRESLIPPGEFYYS